MTILETTSNETKRHCMIVHARYPVWEPRVRREAEALIAVNYEVDVICLRQPGEPAHDIIRGVNVYRLPVHRHKGKEVWVQLFEYLTFFCLACWRLTTLHFQRRYNTVQVHNPPDFLVFTTLIPRLMGAKVILDLHDLMPEFFTTRFHSDWSSLPTRLVRWQERIACRFADHVITVSKHWRQTLIKRGVPANRCSVVMNLADERIFARSPEMRQIEREDSQFCLIYHGAITERYGLDLLLRAVSLVRKEIPGIYLTIVGDGEYRGKLVGMARELDLEGHARFERHIPVEQLPLIITAAHLGIVPYRNDVFTDDLLPTKLMEYAALGVPAIVSRTTGIRAYFDEQMVQFFTPGDVQELAQCILGLHRDRSRLAALARNIQKFNQRYSWMTQKTEYAELVKGLAQR